jgi:hypothetical protein
MYFSLFFSDAARHAADDRHRSSGDGHDERIGGMSSVRITVMKGWADGV